MAARGYSRFKDRVSEGAYDLAATQLTAWGALNQDETAALAKYIDENGKDVLREMELSHGPRYNFTYEINSGADRQYQEMNLVFENHPEVKDAIYKDRYLKYSTPVDFAARSTCALKDYLTSIRDANIEDLRNDLLEVRDSDNRGIIPISAERLKTVMESSYSDQDKTEMIQIMLGSKKFSPIESSKPLYTVHPFRAKEFDVYSSDNLTAEFHEGKRYVAKDIMNAYREIGLDKAVPDAICNENLRLAVAAISHANVSNEQRNELTEDLVDGIFEGKIGSKCFSKGEYFQTVCRGLSDVVRNDSRSSFAAECRDGTASDYDALKNALGNIMQEGSVFRNRTEHWDKLGRELEEDTRLLKRKLEHVPPSFCKDKINRLVEMTRDYSWEHGEYLRKSEAKEIVYKNIGYDQAKEKEQRTVQVNSLIESTYKMILEGGLENNESTEQIYKNNASITSEINNCYDISESLGIYNFGQDVLETSSVDIACKIANYLNGIDEPIVSKKEMVESQVRKDIEEVDYDLNSIMQYRIEDMTTFYSAPDFVGKLDGVISEIEQNLNYETIDPAYKAVSAEMTEKRGELEKVSKAVSVLMDENERRYEESNHGKGEDPGYSQKGKEALEVFREAQKKYYSGEYVLGTPDHKLNQMYSIHQSGRHSVLGIYPSMTKTGRNDDFELSRFKSIGKINLEELPVRAADYAETSARLSENAMKVAEKAGLSEKYKTAIETINNDAAVAGYISKNSSEIVRILSEESEQYYNGKSAEYRETLPEKDKKLIETIGAISDLKQNSKDYSETLDESVKRGIEKDLSRSINSFDKSLKKISAFANNEAVADIENTDSFQREMCPVLKNLGQSVDSVENILQAYSGHEYSPLAEQIKFAYNNANTFINSISSFQNAVQASKNDPQDHFVTLTNLSRCTEVLNNASIYYENARKAIDGSVQLHGERMEKRKDWAKEIANTEQTRKDEVEVA